MNTFLESWKTEQAVTTLTSVYQIILLMEVVYACGMQIPGPT